MALTARQLNRATLQRQFLLERASIDPGQAVRRIAALQAQEPASPYLALWNRLDPFDPSALDSAFATQAVVKAQLMRITLHAVVVDDYPAFHEAMQPTLRAARFHDRRFASEGVSIAEAEALMPDLLAFAATPRSNQDVQRWLEDRYGSPKPWIWWALRQVGPFVHASPGGPWSFGPRPSYVAAHVQDRPQDPEASVRSLVVSYLRAFGPATMADIAQFATIYRPPIQRALSALDGELVRHDGPKGEQLYDVPDGHLPDEDTPAPPRLLPMWDSALLAYADRSRIVRPEYRRHVIRANGDVLPSLLVDGYVAGVWRPIDDGIEATAFHRLSRDDWAALDVEAAALRAFLADRQPLVYGRYGRWWRSLPSEEVRVIGR